MAAQMAHMISLVDICGLSGLDLDQIEAIGEHEHIPDVAAAALASYLLRSPHGLEAVRTMIVDDIRSALTQGKKRHAQELIMALRHLYEQHPELAE